MADGQISEQVTCWMSKTLPLTDEGLAAHGQFKNPYPAAGGKRRRSPIAESSRILKKLEFLESLNIYGTERREWKPGSFCRTVESEALWAWDTRVKVRKGAARLKEGACQLATSNLGYEVEVIDFAYR